MTFGKRKVVSTLQKKDFEKDVDGKHIVLIYRSQEVPLALILDLARCHLSSMYAAFESL